MRNLKDILYVYYPAYILAKCTGFLAYSIEGPPKCRRLKLSKWYSVVSSIIQALIGIPMVLWLFRSVLKYNIPSLLLYLVYLLGLILKYSHYFAFLIAKHAFSEQAIRIFTSLDAMDKKLGRLGVKLPYVRLRTLCLLSLSVSLIADGYNNLIIALLIFQSSHRTWTQLVGILYSTYVAISETIFSLIFFTTVLIFRDMFRNLNASLIKAILRDSNKVIILSNLESVHLKKIMKYYHQLTSILKKYNRIVSPQLLLVIGNQFCYVTLEVFILVQELAAGRVGLFFVLSVTATTCTCMIKIAILIGVSNDCQKQEVILKRTLYKIMNRSNVNVKNEVNAFSLQILHEEIEISAAGFFIVDATVFPSMLSVVVTYATILYQYASNVNTLGMFLGDS